MPKGCYYDQESRSYFWQVDDVELFLDEGLRVCWECLRVRWRRKDRMPEIVNGGEGGGWEVPYMIVEASLAKEGLGDFDWWRN